MLVRPVEMSQNFEVTEAPFDVQTAMNVQIHEIAGSLRTTGCA